jgi:hypothetical protein
MRGSARFLTLAAALTLTVSPVAFAQRSSSTAPTAARPAQAASAAAGSFGMGYTDIGPVLGLGGLGEASFSVGGRFEHAIKELPDLGNGLLGIQVGVDWYHFSVGSFGGTDYSWTYIPINGTVNYHFRVKSNPKIDPFIGLGLGYYFVSTPDCSACNDYNTGLFFVGRAGGRYFFQPKMALYADVGAGAAALNVGLMFKMGGK